LTKAKKNHDFQPCFVGSTKSTSTCVDPVVLFNTSVVRSIPSKNHDWWRIFEDEEKIWGIIEIRVFHCIKKYLFSFNFKSVNYSNKCY
jgi:hypothetical protein